MKRGEQAARIRAAIQQHPALQSHEIATMLGCEVQAVHVVRSRDKRTPATLAHGLNNWGAVGRPLAEAPEGGVTSVRAAVVKRAVQTIVRKQRTADIAQTFRTLCLRAGTVQAQAWLDELREANA